MKKQYTSKLFYNKYIYKLSVRNEIGSIFRGKNLSYAKKKIDEMQRRAESDLPILSPFQFGLRQPRYISLETFVDAAVLYKFIDKNKSLCMLRVEGHTLDIYSNEKDWLIDLSKQVDAKVFYEPKDDVHAEFLLANANTVIVDGPVDWPIKVYLDRDVDPNFANFCRTNKDNIKIGNTALREIETSGYCKGFYFFIKSEKLLMLASIASGNSFGRILKYVSSQKLAK